jgi:hypothetical protein
MKRIPHVLALCVLVSAQPILAQAGVATTDPISGTWTGDIGRNDSERFSVRFEFKFDGRTAITGTVTGPGSATLKSGSFDPSTAAFRLEVDVADGGLTVFEGTAVNGMATGRVIRGNERGTFRLAKSGEEAAAQPSGSADVSAALRYGFTEVGDWVAKGAELVPPDRYNYRPTPAVRSFGQLIGHIADAYLYYCGRASGRNTEWSDRIANGDVSKAVVVRQLQQARDACNAVYAQGGEAGQLMANIAHTNLHYGNMITYLRMLGLTPPSS